MKKIIIFSLLSLGFSNPAFSDIITITLDGDMYESGDPTGYGLDGAHFNWVATIDSGATGINGLYQGFNSNITFTNRPNGASDASASAPTSVRTSNTDISSLGTDSMEIFTSSFDGEFTGLVLSPIDIFFNSDVFGADGLADIPDSWTDSQLAFDSLFGDQFSKNGVTQFLISNVTMTTEFSAVPLPAAAWLFGSGLIGLTGLARRKV
ncbi:MAG: VPLPA-CTERM sorting domain-containing protein [Gammaproteobacteria bacterium]|nr:VPLPA-CTERM sorting domain-containing protein [Gammaproteobacteria bacterium]